MNISPKIKKEIVRQFVYGLSDLLQEAAGSGDWLFEVDDDEYLIDNIRTDVDTGKTTFILSGEEDEIEITGTIKFSVD